MADDFFHAALPRALPDVSGNLCARHPGVPALALCTRCGDYLCSPCVVTSPSEPALCEGCFAVAGGERYHAVPVWRFLALTLCTFNMYTVYWAYRCWQAVKKRDGSDIWPVPRAIFFAFTFFGLLEDVNLQRELRGLPRISSGWAPLYLTFAIGGRVLDRIVGVDDAFGMALSLAFVVLSSAMLVPALRAMREITGQAQLRERDALRARHVIVLVSGALFIALSLAGLAMDSSAGSIYDPSSNSNL